MSTPISESEASFALGSIALWIGLAPILKPACEGANSALDETPRLRHVV